jgi:uncharacterized membrane protein YgcG
MRIIPLLTLLVLLVACGGTPQRELLLVDPAGRLNAPEVAAAVAPLEARGAHVAIIVVEQGDATGADFAQRLAAADLLAGDQIVAEGIALYVSSTPQFSALRIGSRFSARLPSERLDTFREEILNPALRADRFNDGVVATFGVLEAELAAPPAVVRWVRSLPPGVYAFAALGMALLAGWWGVRRRQLEQYIRRVRTDSYARSRAELEALAADVHQLLAERRPVFALRERQTAFAQFEQQLAAYDAERAAFTPDRDVRRSEAALTAQRALRTLRSNYESLMLDIRTAVRTPEEEAALNAALLDHVSGRNRLPIADRPAADRQPAADTTPPTDYTGSSDSFGSGGRESSSSGDW